MEHWSSVGYPTFEIDFQFSEDTELLQQFKKHRSRFPGFNVLHALPTSFNRTKVEFWKALPPIIPKK